MAGPASRRATQPRARTIVQWDKARDGDLVSDLDRFQARGRGARLKYLARLGLLVEAKGALLEGRSPYGALILPVWDAPHDGTIRLAPRPEAIVARDEWGHSTGGGQNGGKGLDALLDSMEEV